jgi:hypothetical protein
LERYNKYGDAKLILYLKKDDRKAFDALYYRYVPKPLSFLKSLYASDDLAAEIVQEIFIKIWENRARINEKYSFEAYILQAAKNRASDKERALIYLNPGELAVWQQQISKISKEKVVQSCPWLQRLMTDVLRLKLSGKRGSLSGSNVPGL